MTMQGLIPTAVAALSTMLTATGPTPVVWNVDKAHTGISFSVTHFLTPVNGRFKDYEIELRYDADRPENSAVQVSIDVSSVDTGNERRDSHLRSADFFQADEYPTMTFTSEEVRRVGQDQLLVRGPLTMKGRTRIVELQVKILGLVDIPEEMRGMVGGASQVASFEASLALDRRDFGVGVGSWAATLVVGADVEVSIALEANRI